MAHDSPGPEVLSSSAFAPSADPITVSTEHETALPAGLQLVPTPSQLPTQIPFPWPVHFCSVNLQEGCYRLSYRPNSKVSFFFNSFLGTVRVDRSAGSYTISGDLYRFSYYIPIPVPIPNPQFPPIGPGPVNPGPISPGPIERGQIQLGSLDLGTDSPPEIPSYPRNNYYSYLKGTNVTFPPIFSTRPCNITLSMDEYVFASGTGGPSTGSFPTSPTRSVTLVIAPRTPPSGFSGPSFSGSLMVGGVVQGTVALDWVSSSFRKMSLQIHRTSDALAPQPVPSASGSGNEDFTTGFATTGWDLNYSDDPNPVPVPAGVVSTNCWADGDLENLASAIFSATDFDSQWVFHLFLVPGQLGCGRGEIFDTGSRRGSVSYCDDGYPSSDSSHFGTATNQEQQHVPRAFLRSACHEIGHGFNMQHQEITSFGEPGADNSFMTTTPSVANVLFAAGQTFPNNIALRFNSHCRHHLIHFPDPVVRPGCLPFGTGHQTAVPSSDLGAMQAILPAGLKLELEPKKQQIHLGEPLNVTWRLTNASQQPIAVPSDLRLKARYAQLDVTGPDGTKRHMLPLTIQTDSSKIEELGPEKHLEETSHVFWSPLGFAFQSPGRHRLELTVSWNDRGMPCQIRASTEVWVNYPTSEKDNAIAAAMLDETVGRAVMLHCRAPHLAKAIETVQKIVATYPDHPVSKSLETFAAPASRRTHRSK